jgi:putative ABC transport system substrate-binding protein
VIYDPEKSETLVSEAATAAESLGIELLSTPVSSHKKVPNALRSMLGKIDALWMVPDDTVITMDSFRFLLVASLENKLPLMAVTDIFVKFGALASIVPDPTEVGLQICRIIKRIQLGELDIADVDVLPPAEANLVLNTKTAKKIGLEVSQGILDTASKVYE